MLKEPRKKGEMKIAAAVLAVNFGVKRFLVKLVDRFVKNGLNWSVGGL